MPRSVFAGLPSSLTGRRRRVAGALGAIAAVALAIGLIIGLGLPGASQGAGQPARPSGSTTVARRDLVATDTVSGTLSYARPQTVFNRLSGTVTSLPAVGQVIKTGRSLYQVDGAPVILFDGTTPAYRDLTSGVGNGSDVEQLNRNLVKLGFDPSHRITLNDTWQAATTTAVESWQASLGETQTGTVSLGQAVFLPGPQRVSSVNTALGSTGGAGAGSGASGATTTGASTRPLAPTPEYVSLTTTAAAPGGAAATATAAPSCPASSSKPSGSQVCCPASPSSTASPRPKTTTPAACPKPTSSSPSQTVAALIALLRAETLELKKSRTTPAANSGAPSGRAGSGVSSAAGAGAATAGSSTRSAAGTTASSGGASGATAGGASATSAGSAAAGATAILGTTSTQLVVTVSLDATKQSEAVVGEPVTVQLPNGNTVDGKITQVSPVAQTASSSASTSSTAGGGGAASSTPSATVPITITLAGRHPDVGLDQAAVSVNLQQQVANNVLSVPVTALLATAGGGYSVQEAQAPHQLIPVTTGLFAAGYVQISGSQIYSGLQVTDSQG